MPDYREIAAALREDITTGRRARGTALPTGPELAATWKVSTGTVNKAVSQLRTEGLVIVKQGRGTIVNPVPVLTREVAARQRRAAREASGARGAFQAELAAQGLDSRSVTEPGRAVPPAAVAALLGIPEGEEAVYRRRVMSVTGEHGEFPVQLATSWLAVGLAGGTAIEEADTGPGGTYSRLGDLGHAPAEFTEELLTRIPDDSEADVLELDPDHRVWEITRRAVDAQGDVVEVNLMTLPAHQWRIVFSWAAED